MLRNRSAPIGSCTIATNPAALPGTAIDYRHNREAQLGAAEMAMATPSAQRVHCGWYTEYVQYVQYIALVQLNRASPTVSFEPSSDGRSRCGMPYRRGDVQRQQTAA